jgi:DNA helicase-2/ATP-dependent DNA helicase PcrA
MQSACTCLEEVLETRYPGWEGRKRDLELLVRLCSRHRTLGGFLETYALDPVTASVVERLENDDCVTLITAHSAKGTEASVCYLIKAEPGQYPHFRSLGDEDAEEEERRVLYVAMTRAMDELILTRSLRRVRFPWSLGPGDGPQAFATSGYFLSSVPASLVTGYLGPPGDEDDDDDGTIVSWRQERQ